MEQQANYIRRIEIHGLWERFNIGWDLRPDVNILSGFSYRRLSGVASSYGVERFGSGVSGRWYLPV